MYFKNTLFFLVSSISFGVLASSNSIWTATQNSQSEAKSTTSNQIFTADKLALEAVMLEGQSLGNTLLTVPLPDGTLVTFNLKYDSILSSELEAQFPELRTYSGSQVNHPENTGRFDYTVQGFHGMFNYEGKMVYVDPVTDQEGSYTSYYNKSSSSFTDEVIGDASQVVTQAVKASSSSRGITEKRTYKLAMSTTGEYAAFFGGTDSQTQAAITTAINRVNQIYTTDLAVSFEISHFNIYLDAAADPFTNTNASADLIANHNDLATKYGAANFDIGHVFSTGGGGLASLGSVCNDSYKGRGVTGSSSPTGDAFYIDYVAHEIGHQFGATHTFNGTQGNCTGSNRTNATAFEPGSGSTVMAYAGICGSDDLQDNSDAYFHGASIDQIRAHVAANPACGTATSLSNEDPEVNAGNDYTIPEGTPFVLSGSATDSNSADTLTYVWEQMNSGTGNSNLTSDLGSGPLFRSWSPVQTGVRYLPRLQDVVDGSLVKGETYPTTSRNLAFRLTVRDGNGGVESDEMTVTVNDTAGPFTVTSPASGAAITSSTEVVWDTAGTDVAPINCSSVNILLSDDGGSSFSRTLVSNTANDGQATVTLPTENITNAYFMVKCSDNIFFALSNKFSVSNSSSAASSSSGGGVTYGWLGLLGLIGFARRWIK